MKSKMAGVAHPTLLRRDDLHVEELDGEAVLYDPTTGAVHRFNEQSKFIWDACNGKNTITDISHLLVWKYAIDYDDAVVHVKQMIQDFQIRNLLSKHYIDDDDDSQTNQKQFGNPANQPRTRNYSRRELIRGGATKLVFTAPLVSTFFATGAYASGVGSADCRPIGFSCTVDADCCDGELCSGDPKCCDCA